MTAYTLSAWLMLFWSGLWTGVILTFAVERTNLWSRMTIEQYAIDFRRSLFRVDPMQPIIGGIAIIAAGIFAYLGAGSPRLWAISGLALIIFVFVTTIAIAEPINSKFRRLAEGQVPEKAQQYRTAWRRFHLFRTVAAIAAFGCLIAAVLV